MTIERVCAVYDVLSCRVWHPNIDVATGKVMMPILGKDWCPVLSINTVLLGLQVKALAVSRHVDCVLTEMFCAAYWLCTVSL